LPRAAILTTRVGQNYALRVGQYYALTSSAAFIEMPCQIVRGGRRLIYRMLSWNPWQGVFLRLVERLHECWLC
jgi:hypothetical protein